MTQTIEQLIARVRELEEENARLNGVIESNIDDGIDKIMAMSDEQVSALAGFEGSNPEDKATIARQCMDIAMLRVDLAATQLHAERLREALEFLSARIVTMDLGGVVERAISLPRDTSALDAYVSEKVKEAQVAYERAAEAAMLLNFKVEDLTRQRDLAVEALEDVRKELQQSNDRLYEEREIWDRVMGDGVKKLERLDLELDDCLYVLESLWDKTCNKEVTEKWAGILIRNKRGIGASSAEDSSEQTTA